MEYRRLGNTGLKVVLLLHCLQACCARWCCACQPGMCPWLDSSQCSTPSAASLPRRPPPPHKQVSVLSFGAWVTFGTQVPLKQAKQLLQAAREAGCNFFDNAEGAQLFVLHAWRAGVV